MIGLERGKVRLVPYESEWARLFEEEARLLHSTLGDRALRIEHVGSTAIEGMDAKPLIDLMIGVEDLEAVREIAPALERIGYEWRADQDSPDHMLFVKGPESARTHYLKFSKPESAYWTNTLLFRDYLRAHPEAAAEYAKLKRELAGRHSEDRGAYTAGKEWFIRRILDLARAGA